jgi:hypothetical protein
MPRAATLRHRFNDRCPAKYLEESMSASVNLVSKLAVSSAQTSIDDPNMPA